MDWEREAVDNLKSYNALKSSLVSISYVIDSLRVKREALRCALSDAKEIELLGKLRSTELLLSAVDNGLAALSAEERRVIAAYIRGRGSIRSIMEDMHVEISQAYVLRNRAIRSFTIAMYGVE
jgi:hypothetical protein